jgi:phenylpyruvate tautomerase PptA (4-oxalocrotonate tautomerase family)
MPVVTVHALPPADPAAVDRCLSAITAALAEALHQDRQGVWAQWVDARAEHTGATVRAFEGHCPVVVVRARAGRHGGVIQAGLRAVAEATSGALGLPLEDVWVHWEELRPGRVFAGGGVR